MIHHQGILEETEENTTKQHFSKVADMNYTGSDASGAGAMACVNSASHAIRTDMQDLPALPAAAAEDKTVTREKAMISKKLKYNQRMYSSLLSLLAKLQELHFVG